MVSTVRKWYSGDEAKAVHPVPVHRIVSVPPAGVCPFGCTKADRSHNFQENMIRKKICMVGLYGVGKTSLVKRYVESIFDERYHTTIGVKIDKKDVVVDGRDVSLAIWDMAGEDEIAQVKLSHLRGASGY